MHKGVVDKKNLRKMLAATAKHATVYAPVRRADGVALAALEAADEVVLDYMNFRLPPKRFFFPPSETIGAYDGARMSATLPAEGEFVLFGIRPCDARSLLLLDRVFLEDKCVDPYYSARRERATIVSLSCVNPAQTCFCTSMEGGPGDPAGADVLVHDLDGTLLFEAVTAKGDALLKKHASLFRAPTDKELAAKDKAAKAAAAAQSPVPASGVAGKLAKKFDSPIWEELAMSCLGCGTCAYLCPTCHCFDLHDEKGRTGGKRVRAYDTCMLCGFSREASGHNPRGSHGARMRQRIMHKFQYTVENFDSVFCVGCGRCVANCPSNVDIRETLTEVGQ
jgi:sulfhydrogenase subunit beta (sulfur reductase)